MSIFLATFLNLTYGKKASGPVEEDVMVWGHTVSLCNWWRFIFKSDFLGPLGVVLCLSIELLSGAAFPGESAFKILQSLESSLWPGLLLQKST